MYSIAGISGWYKFGNSTPTADDEYDMMIYLYQHGPIAVSINALHLRFYSNQILSYCGSNHRRSTLAVLLTGYGVSDSGTPFWIAKTAFGTDWGDGGYFLIQRNVNMCGIAEKAFAAYFTP